MVAPLTDIVSVRGGGPGGSAGFPTSVAAIALDGVVVRARRLLLGGRNARDGVLLRFGLLIAHGCEVRLLVSQVATSLRKAINGIATTSTFACRLIINITLLLLYGQL